MSMAATANAAGKPVRGRPKKRIDLELVEKLAHIQCTQAEIAATLGVSVDTLARHKHFAETYKRGGEGGRKSLRRMQFESATKGNIAMQIWLGKQYLGQSDHLTNEVRRLPSLRDLTTQELSEVLNDHLARFPELAAEIGPLDAEYTVVRPEPPKPAALLLESDKTAKGSADTRLPPASSDH
jgi:hypothetical protein